MEKIFIRTPFNHDTNKFSDDFDLECKDPTLAQQQFAEECDINTLVERFHLTGEMPQLQELPSYDDFTGIFDYQTAMNAIVSARETFMTLPAKLRSRFHNDPQEFVAFCDDPDNHDEAKKLGLLKPATIQEPNTGPQGDANESRTQGPTSTTTQSQAGNTGTTPNASAPQTTQKP